MPQPPNIRTSGTAPQGEITPEEAARVRASVGAKEQAPTSRDQSIFTDWRQVANQLGSPFDIERIPMSRLKLMRRDPMLGFGLSFIKTPHVKARWFINAKDKNGPNAQIAAHLDHDLRRIYPGFTLQYMNCLDFGFQAIAKRFEFRTPAGTFINTDQETGEQTEQPIWSEGNIQPLAWKPFVALPPETVNPMWEGTGDFNGIDYKPGGQAGAPGGVGASAAGGGNSNDKSFKIDLYHSLWVTNEKDQNFGSIFGYPRLGYAAQYWWSYWFRWAIADRAFERKGDPSVLVYHPEGEMVDEQTGERMSYAEYALLMGERMRSGGVIALPSEVYEDTNGRGTIRQWEIDFTKESVNFDPFDKSFEYLDVGKLRALAIPEQAFLEGKGGTSSRNVAAEMGDTFTESQAVLSEQKREHINRFMLPQWLAVNYPDFVANGGTAELIISGFADQDVQFTRDIVQLVGQQESGMQEILKLIDLKRVLEDAGTPLASFADQQRTEQRLLQQAQQQNTPPNVAPVPGQQVGVVPTATGFSYIQPAEVIYLADQESNFIERLPATPHYEDSAVRALARQLWNVFAPLYQDEYTSAARAIEDGTVELSDVELSALDRARTILKNWKGSNLWPHSLDRTKDIFSRIIGRASKLELKRANLSAQLSGEDIGDWINEHLAEIARKVAETTRTEVRDFVALQVEKGVTDRAELAQKVRDHFADFPSWKTERLVRTEVRDVYNAATLLAAQAAEIDTVQAVDAQHGTETDDECMERDGQIFRVRDAFRETEHPNGTLAWRILPVNLSIEHHAELDGGVAAKFDKDRNVVLFTTGLPGDARREYLKAVVNRL